MSKCIAGRAPKRGRQGYSICAWRGEGSEGRGERIDYTPRITLGPFSIIFRWNINRAVNNNPLYRGVRTHTHTHTQRRGSLFARIYACTQHRWRWWAVGEIKRYSHEPPSVRNALGAEIENTPVCFAPLTLEPVADQLITTLVFNDPRGEGEDAWHPAAEVWRPDSCDGRSWNVVYRWPLVIYGRILLPFVEKLVLINITQLF